MKESRRFEVVEHLSEDELKQAIDDAQSAGDSHLVRRLCFVKGLYAGMTQQQAGDAVGVSQPTSSRWARAWNDGAVEGIRRRFGGGPPPKLTPEQWAEFCDLLREGQPWTSREIHAFLEERYGVTYSPSHLARKLRAAGVNYAKPRPMDPRSPDYAEEILAERLDGALGEARADTDADGPVVLGFFR